MVDIKILLKTRSAKIDKWLSTCFENRTIPSRLKDSMLYSLLAGGKRIRPVLCLTCSSLCGLCEDKVLPFACAIEMIHTYSLIHDDLPAMDNDDLRRGKPSNHKAYDEATAILAGDGLLTDAFSFMCLADVRPEYLIIAIKKLSSAAGSSGMVGGQELDMLYTGENNISINDLQRMQSLKTGAMIEAACVCGALLAGSDAQIVNALGKYGIALGNAFQITDDILDLTSTTSELGKPARSDEKSGKNTYPSMIGLENSKALAYKNTEIAKDSLSIFSGMDAEFLRSLADYVVQRTA